MYTNGYGLFLSEGQYDGRTNTLIGFSLNKDELEEEIKKLELEFEVFETEFKNQESNVDYYIGRFNNDWMKYFTDNVRSLYKVELLFPDKKPVTKEEHKEWCRIKNVNNRGERFNQELNFNEKKKFLVNWMKVDDTSIRKIFVGSCPYYFIAEMNESF
jgi:hypothetical protein